MPLVPGVKSVDHGHESGRPRAWHDRLKAALKRGERELAEEAFLGVAPVRAR